MAGMKLKRRYLHLDRKGFGLLMMGIIWILVAISVPDRPRYEGVFTDQLGDALQIVLYMIGGVLACLGAWVPKMRPWAVFALIVGPGIRFFGFLFSWVVYLIPGGNPGFNRGWISALAQLIMIGFVFYVAADTSEHDSADQIHKVLTDGDE